MAELKDQGLLITNVRHYDLLCRTKQELELAQAAFEIGTVKSWCSCRCIMR